MCTAPKFAPGRLASRQRSCLVLCLLLIFASLVGDVAAQVRAGTIKELRGTGEIQRNARSIAATIGMQILTGDRLQTSRHSSLTVELTDGTRLLLSDMSSMVIDRTMTNAADSTIDLFKGKLRSIVNLVAGKQPAFEIHTPNAVASVRGTEFETEYIEGRPCPGFPQCFRYTDVGVYKGIVEVRNPTSSRKVSVQVGAGYETTVPCELPPAIPGPLGMGDLMAPGYH